MVAELGGTDRNKNNMSHVWHHLRWNIQELGGTQVEHTCSIKIGETKGNKPFIPNIPLPSFLRRPTAAASGDLLLPPPATSDDLRRPAVAASGDLRRPSTSSDLLYDRIRWLWTCGGGGGAVVVVM